MSKLCWSRSIPHTRWRPKKILTWVLFTSLLGETRRWPPRAIRWANRRSLPRSSLPGWTTHSHPLWRLPNFSMFPSPMLNLRWTAPRSRDQQMISISRPILQKERPMISYRKSSLICIQFKSQKKGLKVSIGLRNPFRGLAKIQAID